MHPKILNPKNNKSKKLKKSFKLTDNLSLNFAKISQHTNLFNVIYLKNNILNKYHPSPLHQVLTSSLNNQQFVLTT